VAFVTVLKSVGLGLIVTGVILLVASFIPVPHTYTRPVVERYTLPTTTPVRGVLIDETRVVPAGGYTSNCYIFHRDTTLYISVSVLQGGNRDINFWVMNRENLDSFASGRAFYYYTAPSRKQISEAHITWKPPTEKEICFVLDNTFSLLSSKTVKISITYEYEVKAQTTITVTRTVTETEFLYPFTFFHSASDSNYCCRSRSCSGWKASNTATESVRASSNTLKLKFYFLRIASERL
jgi:hypothetical protein